MIDLGRHAVLGVRISAVDYAHAVDRILDHARRSLPLGVSALAVHGVMTGFLNPIHRRRLNGLDLVVPDGQPVRWALMLVHRIRLPSRVYGPDLTLKILAEAARVGLPVYFYGSTAETLSRLEANLRSRFPGLRVAGMEPSKFRRLSPAERDDVVSRIRSSGARLVFAGLGCPRQEVWAYEYRDRLKTPVIAVGAAFNFLAGLLPQAPSWMQRTGLEWLYRLGQEPARLWKRYLLLNPLYAVSVLFEWLGLAKVRALTPTGQEPQESFG